jgi:hypothetical protein
MAHESELELLIALALRLKGFGEVADVAAIHGLDVDAAAATLSAMAEAGACMAREVEGVTKYVLTPTGRETGQAALGTELDNSGARDQVRAAYDAFLRLNGKMLQLCTDWQVIDDGSGDQRLNDHTDDDYDQEVMARLVDIDGELRKVLAPLRAALSRYDAYPPRFREALDRLLGGDLDYFTKPIIASYHTVWFELHEDLLATLGIDRASEGST